MVVIDRNHSIIKLLLIILGALLLSACGSAETYTLDDAVAAIQAAELENEDCGPFEVNGPLPQTYEDAIRCVAPSVRDNYGYHIFQFNSQRNLETVEAYYNAFSGAFANHTFRNGNLLFQVGVGMPIELVEQYEEAFMSIGQ